MIARSAARNRIRDFRFENTVRQVGCDSHVIFGVGETFRNSIVAAGAPLNSVGGLSAAQSLDLNGSVSARPGTVQLEMTTAPVTCASCDGDDLRSVAMCLFTSRPCPSFQHLLVGGGIACEKKSRPKFDFICDFEPFHMQISYCTSEIRHRDGTDDSFPPSARRCIRRAEEAFVRLRTADGHAAHLLAGECISLAADSNHITPKSISKARPRVSRRTYVSLRATASECAST